MFIQCFLFIEFTSYCRRLFQLSFNNTGTTDFHAVEVFHILFLLLYTPTEATASGNLQYFFVRVHFFGNILKKRPIGMGELKERAS